MFCGKKLLFLQAILEIKQEKGENDETIYCNMVCRDGFGAHGSGAEDQRPQL